MPEVNSGHTIPVIDAFVKCLSWRRKNGYPDCSHVPYMVWPEGFHKTLAAHIWHATPLKPRKASKVWN